MTQRRQGEAALTDRLPCTSEMADESPQGIAIESPAVRKRKPRKTSPTQRSLKHMREQGYVCAIVEKWNPHARIRQDMFGFIDIVCIRGEEIVGVQACSGGGGDSAERVRKITEHENWPLICKAIRVVVQSWRKNAAGNWVLREVEL